MPECFVSSANHALHSIRYIHPSFWRVDICVGWQKKGKETWNIFYIHSQLNSFGFDSTWSLSFPIHFPLIHQINIYSFGRHELSKHLKFKVYIFIILGLKATTLVLLAPCSYSQVTPFSSLFSVYYLSFMTKPLHFIPPWFTDLVAA